MIERKDEIDFNQYLLLLEGYIAYKNHLILFLHSNEK